ncbi:hypothetical protein GFD17_05790 [Bifidobacterium sp. SMB2]|nr:right-handed parallel beta-helix repeat-containing protein [Bifidobacterium sp. SMB2]NEG96270.1 hypothetical protein [Bifidobacterium sp. SMB2]
MDSKNGLRGEWGISGRNAISRIMNGLGDAAPSGRRRGVRAIAAMAAAAAMLAVGVPAAGAAESTGFETEPTVTATPSQSPSASNGATTSSTPSSQDQNAQGTTPKTQKKGSQKKAAAKATGDCAAVTTWDVLKSCMDGAATDGSTTTVTLTASIEVPTDTNDAESTPLDQNHVLYVNNGAKITLKAADGAGLDGARSGDRKGSVIYVYPGGSLTIAGGTYQSIDTKEQGAVIMNDGTVDVTGGTFRNNTSAASGGVISSSGTVDVTGGTFIGNGQSPADDCSTDATVERCHQSNLGGGAIHSTGSLLVQGNVTFDGNYAKSWSWRAGGGAIWASGKLWVKNATDGTKPKFVNNYTSVAKPARAADGTWTGIQRGGAGGAIFLNGDSSMAWLTGGSYTNNVSGYLGGAVYTEEDSTTYVGKAVAFDNAAGHFGGGLWFCPSGNATASQGGNIALFDNDVNTTLDGNGANTAAAGNTVTAGDDLAIMNPYHKWYGDPGKFTSNSFHLLDTWFTDRSNPAVTWYRDGTPLMESSGYFDSWLPDSGGWYGHGNVAVQAKANPVYPTEKVTTPHHAQSVCARHRACGERSRQHHDRADRRGQHELHHRRGPQGAGQRRHRRRTPGDARRGQGLRPAVDVRQRRATLRRRIRLERRGDLRQPVERHMGEDRRGRRRQALGRQSAGRRRMEADRHPDEPRHRLARIRLDAVPGR